MVLDMTKGDPIRGMLRFFFPVLLGNLLQQLYNVADSMIVSRFLGVDAFSGVSATGSLCFLIFGFALGICSGFAIPIAQEFGAGNHPSLRRYFANALYMAGIISVYSNERMIKMENAQPKKQYTNCYIAFLDLLGFKNRVKNSSCEDILNIYQQMKNPLKKIYIGDKNNKAQLISGPENINTKVMSDSICFWIDAALPNSLYSLICCCSIFQAKLAGLPYHVFIRGAIVKGDIYAKDDITFGPGLTMAYLLEENSAKYPRIILTRETLESGINPESDITNEKYYDATFCDFDEFMTINYLDTLKGLDNNKFPPDELKKHIDEVLGKEFDSSVKEKYIYLKKYYSRVFD